MTKTSGDYEKEFIETAKEKTGRSLAEWLPVLKASGLSKQKELLNWIKAEHKLNHLQASLLSGLFLNNGQPVYQNEENLLDNQFTKCESMRSFYEEISQKIHKMYADCQIIPKKTYVSFTVKREFAAINIKTGELRLGMDLGDMPFSDRLQKTKLSGPMPRISHMVVLKTIADFDAELEKLLQQSYNRCHHSK